MNHDVLIDQIARDMTEDEPRADFHARVMARVAPRRRWPRVAVPLSAIATAAICAWMLVPAHHAGVAVSSPVIATAPVAVAQASQTADPATQDLRTGQTPRVRTARTVVSAEELAWRARAIPALPPASALSLDSIQPQPLSIAPITVHPIVSDPLTLAAIDPRAGGRE